MWSIVLRLEFYGQGNLDSSTLEDFFRNAEQTNQLKESGDLGSPEGVARKLIQPLLIQSFGLSPCTDLRGL